MHLTILVINWVIALAAIFVAFEGRREKFSLFNAGLTAIIFGIIFLLGTIPVWHDFTASSMIIFVAIILIVLGIIMLVVSWITREYRMIEWTDMAVSLLVAAMCLLYLLPDKGLAYLVVPELAMIGGLVLLYLVKTNKLR